MDSCGDAIDILACQDLNELIYGTTQYWLSQMFDLMTSVSFLAHAVEHFVDRGAANAACR